MVETLTVLSIQSEVVHGHVGNGAARLAMQRLGVEVWAVPTVLLSNHPGHGKFRGETIAAAKMAALIDGLAEHGWLKRCDAVISGYLGEPGQARVVADAVARVKAANGKALYLCDPVFGDEGGAYARPGVAEAMARELLPVADIVTPNCFELASLTSRKIADVDHAVAAARTLALGEVVVTSVPFAGGRIGTVVTARSEAWATVAARLDSVPFGSGDLFAAGYLTFRLTGETPDKALVKASSAVDQILRASAAARADELLLVAMQDALVRPAQFLALERVESAPSASNP